MADSRGGGAIARPPPLNGCWPKSRDTRPIKRRFYQSLNAQKLAFWDENNKIMWRGTVQSPSHMGRVHPFPLQIAGNSLPNWRSTGCLVSIFISRINSKSFTWSVRSAQERYLLPTQIFGNVRCPILRIKTNSTPQCWCGLATDIWKKNRLNWKPKISNAADNADIRRHVTLGIVECRK